jgi:hypothetical protein
MAGIELQLTHYDLHWPLRGLDPGWCWWDSRDWVTADPLWLALTSPWTRPRVMLVRCEGLSYSWPIMTCTDLSMDYTQGDVGEMAWSGTADRNQPRLHVQLAAQGWATVAHNKPSHLKQIAEAKKTINWISLSKEEHSLLLVTKFVPDSNCRQRMCSCRS